MKRTVLYILLLLLLPMGLSAQVTVSGSTGADAIYPTLAQAFTAINGTAQTGNNILITITSSTTETASAALNAGTWTSLNIFPTVSGIIISGNLAAPLIDLNGADNVIIDGRVNHTGTTKDLTIINTSTAATAGTSTIRWINGATSNTVKYCTLKGSETVSTSGILFFSTTIGTPGNNLNFIDTNNITGSTSDNRAINAIYSAGTATNVNNGNSVRYNNIFDNLNKAFPSNGIYIAGNNSEWTISENSFYETTSFVPTASSAYYLIQINNTGGDYIVSGNFMGGSAPSCGGTPLTKANAANNVFFGIYLIAGTGTSNSIQNNIVSNIDWSNSTNGAWTGIQAGRGNVNIGTVTGNTIGAESGTGSILVTSETNGNNVFGINIASPGTVNCLNNKIGAITIANADANGSNFYGINKTNSAGATIISNNTIGSTTTANSINASSASSGNAQAVRGIYNAGTGAITISNNTIANMTNGTRNVTVSTLGKINGIFSSSGTNNITDNIIHDLTISNANNQLYLNASACGISLSGPTFRNISGNTIYNLSNNFPGFSGGVIGIYFMGGRGNNKISRNFIHSLSVSSSSSAASIYGIRINTGASTYSNNIISLCGNTATTIYGIYETGVAGDNNNLYFNTVFIGGSPPSGTNKSYALNSGVISNVRDFRNNIFVNARSTPGGANLHYAMYIFHSGGAILCNNNDYWVSGNGGILGYFSGDKSTLPIVSGQDVASLSVDPIFAFTCGTSATDYLPSASTILAATGTEILTDYVDAPRSATYPSMGAYEILLSTKVEVYKSSVLQASYFHLKEAFDAFNSGIHNTGSFEIKLTGNVNEISSAILNASGSGSANYTSILIYPTAPGITLSGNLAAPLIDLNGADNVTIDGRVNATGTLKDMTITNTSIEDTAITSTVRMINGTTNNIVKYCRLKGSGTGAGSGIILFSTSTEITGNNLNIIDNNDFTGSTSSYRPINCIYSSGSATKENTGDSISNNNFYDNLNKGLASNGIYLAANNSDWTLSGNSFYETASLVPAANVPYYFIQINNTGGNYSVTGNFIGGSTSACGGPSFTKTNAFSNIFYGIHLTAGTGTVNNIQNNTIRNIDWSNSLNGSWTGIHIGRGDVNVGTVTGNLIGDTTTTGSILVTCKTNASNVFGINIASQGTITCQNNKIGSLTIANADTNGSNFYGINKTFGPGTLTISNNTIGGTSISNSILASSQSTGNAQTVRGIYNAGSGIITISNNTIGNLTNSTTNADATTLGKINGIFSSSGTNTISDNIIHDLTIANANNQTNLNVSVCGIALSGPTLKNVTGNTIYNLSNTNTTFSGYVQGLFFTGSTGGNSISRNFIHSLTVNSSSATIYGIQMIGGASTYSNNIIALGGNTPTTLYGIYETGIAGNNNNLYFNTVSICGSPASGSNKSYALYSAVTTNTRDFRNNILVNTRSTSGGTNLHYALYIVNAAGNIICDHNDYWVSGTEGTLGYYGANKPILPIVTGQDGASQSVDPMFALACGITAADYKPSTYLKGTNITGITTDYGLSPRSIPIIGAWEAFKNYWKGSLSTDWNTDANWTADTVPGPDESILFDVAPLNNLIMDQDRSVTNITDSTSYRIVTNGHKLTIKGNFYFSPGPKIDATASGSTVDFAGSSVQTILDNQFLNNQIANLAISNITGVTLNSDLTIDNSLTINNGTSLTVMPSRLLNVPGTITNNAGTDGLVLKSSATGDAKLLTGSSTSGTVELYLTGGLVTPDIGIFHYIETPVQTMHIGSTIDEVNTNLGLSSFDGSLLAYSEPAAVADKEAGWKYFDGYPAIGSPYFTDLTPTRGYNIFLTDNDTMSFKGQLNTSSNNFTLDYTATNPDRGWNLIGNPFPCNFNLNGVAGLGTIVPGIANTVYYNNNGGYSYWNVYTNTGSTTGLTDILPPMTGFFVHVSQTGMSLSLPASSKTAAPSDSREMHKGASEGSGKALEVRKVKLVLNSNSKSDETIAMLFDDATTSYNEHYDAFKLSGKNYVGPQIYSVLNGTKYFMKAVAATNTSSATIPLRVIIKEGGTHEILISEFENLEGIKVTLKHGKTEKLLRPDLSYKFTTEAGTYDNFELIFGESKSSKEPDVAINEIIRTWYSDNYLYVSYSGDFGSNDAKMIIYDYSGTMVYNNRNLTLLPEQTNQIAIPLKQGFYITDIEIGGKHHRLKFVVY